MLFGVESYVSQAAKWPAEGRHILAGYDNESIVVYQAYNHAIADYAMKAGQLAGPQFSLDRMSWIKPNFLWMMYRSGWATKPNQERLLAIRMSRKRFDAIVAAGVPSSFDPARYASHDDWKAALAASEVRLQWDPDHDPAGRPLARRAIQLGLRGETLEQFATTWAVEDITSFVVEQRQNSDPARWDRLIMPIERVYVPAEAPVYDGAHPRHPNWPAFVDALVMNPEAARSMLQEDPTLLESRGTWGETPLHYLAVENYADAVDFLLSLGADPDPKNDFDETPLLSCVSICRPEFDLLRIVHTLLARGASPYHFTKTQGCAWHKARRSEDSRIRKTFSEFPPPGKIHDQCEFEDMIVEPAED